MVPNEELHILTIHFEPPKRRQPLYKGQDVLSQGVLYMEVPLYMHFERVTLISIHYQCTVIMPAPQAIPCIYPQLNPAWPHPQLSSHAYPTFIAERFILVYFAFNEIFSSSVVFSN